MEDFITGRSVISSSGAFAPPDPASARHHETKLDAVATGTDSGDGETRDIALAARTSQLMSSYRSYIAGQEDEEVPEADRRGHRTVRSRSSAGFGNAHNPLLREWNYSTRAWNSPGQYGLEMEEDCDGEDLHGGDVHGNGYRYAVLRSKKFKQLLVAGILIIATILTVSKSTRKTPLSGGSKESKNNSLENIVVDWTEQGDKPGDTNVPAEGLLVGEEEPSKRVTVTEPHQNIGIDSPSTAEEDQTGDSNVSAEDESVSEDKPEERITEPHVDTGSDSLPPFAEEDQRGDSGATISDLLPSEEEPNERKTVMPHGNFGIDAPSSVEEGRPGDSVNSPKEEPKEGTESTKEVVAAKPVQNIGIDLPTAVQEDEPGGSDSSAADEALTEGTGRTEDEVVALDVDSRSPEQEEEPGNLDAALTVPVVKEKSDEILESTEEEEEKDVPTWPLKEEDVPTWPLKEEDVREEGAEVLSGAGLEAITRHILCCSSSSNTLHNLEAINDELTNTANNPSVAEYAHAGAFHPRWYDRSTGWRGRTYQEALIFCTEQRGTGEDDGRMRLCPYAVYCPAGPRQFPLGGLRMEENEEGGTTHAYSSRSPISDRPDGWVQVGSLHVCEQYEIVNGDDGSQVKKEVNSR